MTINKQQLGSSKKKKRTMLDFMIQTRQKLQTGKSWWCKTRPYVPNMEKLK